MLLYIIVGGMDPRGGTAEKLTKQPCTVCIITEEPADCKKRNENSQTGDVQSIFRRCVAELKDFLLKSRRFCGEGRSFAVCGKNGESYTWKNCKMQEKRGAAANAAEEERDCGGLPGRNDAAAKRMSAICGHGTEGKRMEFHTKSCFNSGGKYRIV